MLRTQAALPDDDVTARCQGIRRWMPFDGIGRGREARPGGAARRAASAVHRLGALSCRELGRTPAAAAPPPARPRLCAKPNQMTGR